MNLDVYDAIAMTAAALSMMGILSILSPKAGKQLAGWLANRPANRPANRAGHQEMKRGPLFIDGTYRPRNHCKGA